MGYRMARDDRFGVIRPSLDAHTLGLMSFAQLLGECGHRCIVADGRTCAFADALDVPDNADGLVRWIRDQGITALGFSYRLDPVIGVMQFERLCHVLRECGLLAAKGGPIKGLFFAGLPEACRRARWNVPEVTGVFQGDETNVETLRILGIPATCVPRAMLSQIQYDEDRLAFGRDLVRSERYQGVRPVDRKGALGYGTRSDGLVARLNHGLRLGLPPLMRAHVGPYLPEREDAVALFLNWSRQLAESGLLDVLSVGTSQLSQSAFGEDWSGRPNGGGVPLNSPEEFEAVWEAARPMLVRAYAGTNRVPELAAMYERAMNIAWHALSFWWFCRLDGRGPLTVEENLRQHLEAISYIASTGKPLEANVAHHFSFRGADDVTAIVATALAARTAKSLGIRHFVLQIMLNTPKTTWGIQDLAKARVMLRLTRELEDERFRVILQPRGGLDYFSPHLDKAKAQLAAVTALMDDIEPYDRTSPALIHVVSYSEANNLADPDAVNESIRITRHALLTYRQLREDGEIDDMGRHEEAIERTDELEREARTLLAGMEAAIPSLHTAVGLHQCFERGFLPVPDLWAERDKFPRAVAWKTKMVKGGMRLVGDNDVVIGAAERVGIVNAWFNENGSRTGDG